ncbi:MAG: cytochrome-c oxidase, cbb3-type subunit I [Planctomycetes bacterium]|jgi:cytochrome c oxidase cbb3-type subunit I/II|nr:cytochrome-c oxidase, cbb3-type subunit I [Planctomycetota bacterium]
MHSATVTETRRVVYDDATVRGFVWASVIWGAIGLLVGLVIALQLSFPFLSFDTSWLTFGRLRPLHTNAVIFALVGNMMFAGVYYSTQRLLKTRMASDLLSKVHLWGWQLIILGAAVTLPLGITQSKEYAELEWFLDIAVVLVWVAFAVNFFWSLAIRNEKNLYVAIWFYISTVLTIAVLYIVNNLSLPITGTKSYGVFAGAQDALTQWWYGHNAVAFFLTTPILGIMYYFLPKAAERPIFSYRLSIVHFWALVFIYIWAGPHHLLNTALPDWAQSLGMLFSLMLWAPSWGGMLNGLLTLRGAYHKVRTDPVLKFFVAGVTFYGMATFEGPLLSIKAVSGLAHYTDWIIGHVHSGALGWNGFMAAGMFYWLVPKLYGTKLHSTKLADYHFWLGMIGILIYVAAMWVSGISQGLMWRAETADGGLQYTDWSAMLNSQQMMYYVRSIGGGLYLVGWLLMAYNLVVTAISGRAVTVESEVSVTRTEVAPGEPSTLGILGSKPVVISVIGMVAATMFAMPSIGLAVLGLVLLLGVVAFAAGMLFKSTHQGRHTWHERIEARPLAFTLLTLLAVVVGGVYELLPGLVTDKAVPLAANGEMCVKPYTALELTGRDIYVREGCYVCHSQMIRPFREEQLRYGAPSRIEESMWDHPFQWGSKRTGPDLARVGTKYNEAWHWDHMQNPRAVFPASIMPAYPWLYGDRADQAIAGDKMAVLKKLGTPYSDEQLQAAVADYKGQAATVVGNLASQGKTGADPDSEIVALIAYLMRLGRNLEPVKGQASLQGGK